MCRCKPVFSGIRPWRPTPSAAPISYAFGSEANAAMDAEDSADRHECASWLLALITWLDDSGWRHSDSSKLS